jgi:hypothetical protein
LRSNNAIFVISNLSTYRKFDGLRNRGLTRGVAAIDYGQAFAKIEIQFFLDAPKRSELNV